VQCSAVQCSAVQCSACSPAAGAGRCRSSPARPPHAC
jgi:hypothetical protein